MLRWRGRRSAKETLVRRDIARVAKAPADAADRPTPAEPRDNGARIVVAERFDGPPRLAGIRLPLDSFPPGWEGMIDVLVREDATGGGLRRSSFPVGAASARPDEVRVSFPPFENADGRLFTVIVATEADGVPSAWLVAGADALAAGRPPIMLSSMGQEETPAPQAPLRYHFDLFWCDRNGLFMQGWIHAFDRTILRLVIEGGDAPCVVDSFSPRDDVWAHFKEFAPARRCGFQAYVRWNPGTPVVFRAETDQGVIVETAALPPGSVPNETIMEGHHAFQALADEINERRLAVLEVGSRKVSANWSDMRNVFHRASRFIGMDIHPGPGVDIVGDAHFLDRLTGPASVDAVFSLSVMEHLANPWRFARSVSAALRIGGLTYHATHQTWPMHEEPNDFWRYSDEGLKALFGPDNGFEVITAGLCDRVAIYPLANRADHLMMPLVSAFGCSFILARKVRQIDDADHAPGSDPGRSEERAKSYPRRDD